MLTLNETGPHAGRYLYRTHEVGSNGSLSVTDLVTGITRIVANASHYEALDGLTWTPWGTVLFAEERIVASLKDPQVPNAVGGLVYEYDPATETTRPLPALGARSHEGLRFDSHGNLYGISESTPGSPGQSGAIFKFVPDMKGDLTSGQLYALRVLDASKTGAAVWVPLDRDAVKINSDAEAIRVGATGWARPEDVEIATSTGNNRGGVNVMYVATTTDALVLRIALDGDHALVSNFVRQGVNVQGLQNPDNLALDQQGNLYIAEDNGPGDIWVAYAKGPGELVASEVVRFASLTDCAAEPTGIFFDRSGQTLYVNVQHAGGPLAVDLTVAIRRTR
jgi:secreted PhoX family phosphatase